VALGTTPVEPLHPAAIEIIELTDKLRKLVRRATSCAPDPSLPKLGEHDFNALSRALARTMALCAEQLHDAGFETDDVIELAETIAEELPA
jgi:hypothetical protein